jgi:histidyl-tRNA synthetase
MKRDVFELLSSRADGAHLLNEKAPRSMDFLSETSRRHLEEILEYFEKLGIRYTINPHLLGNRSYCTETIFTITNADLADKKSKQQRILATGVRYNGLAKRFGVKRDIQGVGISLLIPSNEPKHRAQVKKMKKPIASFMQLSLESKLISLSIIETLRQVKIPLYLSLAKDRLGAQVSSIERHHMPYSIVIGKKEAVERTAIVRKTDTHAQEIVSLDDLPAHMKKLDK